MGSFLSLSFIKGKDSVAGEGVVYQGPPTLEEGGGYLAAVKKREKGEDWGGAGPC